MNIQPQMLLELTRTQLDLPSIERHILLELKDLLELKEESINELHFLDHPHYWGYSELC
jgi:hypothetical protein